MVETDSNSRDKTDKERDKEKKRETRRQIDRDKDEKVPWKRKGNKKDESQ